MALLAGHMTKLQAVNDILWTIGESPVNSLQSGLPDAELAEALLGRVSRQVQLQGWHCNTLRNYVLSVNASNQFGLPDNTLTVDTSVPRGIRTPATSTPSSQYNVVMRRSSDDTKWLLWDVDKGSETWTDVSTLTVNLVQNLEFENLAPALQMYVWTKAARRFQTGAMGSGVLHEITAEDETNALTMAEQEDAAVSDINALHDNPHAHSIVYRRNPNYGR